MTSYNACYFNQFQFEIHSCEKSPLGAFVENLYNIAIEPPPQLFMCFFEIHDEQPYHF